jgi:hypothetical protein
VVILNEGPYQVGTKVLHQCPHCGYMELENENLKKAISERDIPDADVFFIRGTSQILVTERVRDLIKSNRCSNVEFAEFEVL